MESYFFFTFTVTSWHAYQERLFADPVYTSLKLQCPNPFPDSTSHLAATNLPVPPDSSGGNGVNYHQYGSANFRHQHETGAAVSSTDPDYGAGTTVHNASTSYSQVHHGINLHQRRGSLQLWQFLVALLDEPTQR